LSKVIINREIKLNKININNKTKVIIKQTEQLNLFGNVSNVPNSI